MKDNKEDTKESFLSTMRHGDSATCNRFKIENSTTLIPAQDVPSHELFDS